MEGSMFYSTIWALLPPLIAIVLALITKEVYSSLIIGVICGGLLVTNFNIVLTVDNVISNGIIEAIKGTAGIFAFLVFLGIIVALINKAGGSEAFGRWASKNIKSKMGASIATFILGVLIFIDDYFNCLTVGGVMRPVTDTHKVSRAKLAYLIDATAAPICMIAPISSWAAAVSEFTEGTGYSGLELFIRAIPYNFYSLLTLVFILAITIMKVDFGPMRKHELNAEKGDLFSGVFASKELEEKESVNPNGKVIDLVLPVLALIVISVLSLIYVGGFFAGEGTSFVDAFAGTDATVGLPLGGFVVLVLTVIYLLVRKSMSFKEAMECIPKGFIAMVPAILILTLATALKNMTGLLGGAEYVKGVMDGAAAGLSNFLPAVIFLVAVGLSFSTGTSWGTFGILIPIVCNIFPGDSELLIIGMSACLAGAVCGDHCSPISDTTIMSSAGAQCDHVTHVSTQLPYSLTVAAISFVAFLISGFVQNAFIMLPIFIVVTVGLVYFIKISLNKEASKQA